MTEIKYRGSNFVDPNSPVAFGSSFPKDPSLRGDRQIRWELQGIKAEMANGPQRPKVHSMLRAMAMQHQVSLALRAWLADNGYRSPRQFAEVREHEGITAAYHLSAWTNGNAVMSAEDLAWMIAGGIPLSLSAIQAEILRAEEQTGLRHDHWGGPNAPRYEDSDDADL